MFMSKIIIVEDEVAIRHMYGLKLKFAGHTIYEAGDGAEGLEVIKAEKPDIVLLDLMMPRMDGTEMLRELRSTDWGKAIPVIVLTNISRDEAPRTLWHLGISEFIIKANSTPQKILECVERVLQEENHKSQ